jgi:predicted RNA-binding protein
MTASGNPSDIWQWPQPSVQGVLEESMEMLPEHAKLEIVDASGLSFFNQGLPNYWIVPTNIDLWNIVKKNGFYAFRRRSSRDKFAAGDRLVFYLTRSKPPVFVGAAEVTSACELAPVPFWPNRPWRFTLKMLKMGAADVRSLIGKLSFVENKEDWGFYFCGSLANFNRPISEVDYQVIFDELALDPELTWRRNEFSKKRVLENNYAGYEVGY